MMHGFLELTKSGINPVMKYYSFQYFVSIDTFHQSVFKCYDVKIFNPQCFFDDKKELDIFYLFDKVYFVLYSVALRLVACSSNLPGTEHVLFR